MNRVWGSRTAQGSVILFCLCFTAFLFFFQFFLIGHTAHAADDINLNQIVALTNEERSAENIPALASSSRLFQVAQMRADDMASREYFAHETPEGIPFWQHVSQSGYQYSHVGENLAVHFYTPEQLVNAWMRSPSHKANILNPDFEEIGLGIAEGIRRGHKGYYVVQIFGTLLSN